MSCGCGSWNQASDELLLERYGVSGYDDSYSVEARYLESGRLSLGT